MVSMGSVYASVRERVTHLVGGLGSDELEQVVPTCPEWRVRDVVAHLTGVCADIVTLNLEGVATEAWTAAQVAERKDRSLDEILAEWADVGPRAESLADQVGGRRVQQWVADATTHEHDLRHAVRRPGARDSDAVRLSVDLLVEAGVAPGFSVRRLGPVEIRTTQRAWVVGVDGPPPDVDAETLRAEAEAAGARVLDGVDEPPLSDGPARVVLEVDDFELFRGLTGRRSAAQLGRWRWSDDPAPYVGALEFAPFRFSAVDIDE